MASSALGLEMVEAESSDMLYSEMVAPLTEEFAARANRVVGALIEAVPPLDIDIHHTLRHVRMRFGRSNFMSGLIGNAPEPETADAFKMAQAGIRQRLETQARMAMAYEDQNDLNQGWTRFLGRRLGKHVRGQVNLWQEGGYLSTLRFNPEERRVMRRVRRDMAAIESCGTIEEVREYDLANGTNYDQIIGEEVGRLAPNRLAFDLGDLRTWAQNTESNVVNQRAAGNPRFTYLQIVGQFVDADTMGSDAIVPILSLVQKDEAYRTHLEAMCRELRTGETPVDDDGDEDARAEMLRFYSLGQTVKARRDREYKTRVARLDQYKAAVKAIRDLRTKINAFHMAEKALEDERAKGDSSSPQGKVGLRNAEKARNSAVVAISNILDSSYPNAIQGIDRNDDSIPEVFRQELPLVVNETGSGATRAFTLSGENDLETCFTEATEALEQEQRLQDAQLAIWEEERDAPYSADAVDANGDPDESERQLAGAGFYNLAALKKEYEEVDQEAAEASRTMRRRFSPHELMFELSRRVLSAGPQEIFPGAEPRMLSVEEVLKRATIRALQISDRVDTDVDEGIAVRRALEASGTHRKGDITVAQFLEQDEALKELGLSDASLADDFIQAVHSGELSEQQLADAMRRLERFAQDQLDGAQLVLDPEQDRLAHNLLTQIKMAFYRLRADEIYKQVEDPTVSDRAGAVLKLLREGGHKMIVPPPRPGEPPVKLKSASQVAHEGREAELEAELEGLDEDSPMAKAIQKQLKILRKTNSVVIADVLSTVALKAPQLWTRARTWLQGMRLGSRAIPEPT